MPYLAARLIMPLSCDKSGDSGKAAGTRKREEERPAHHSRKRVYFRQRASARGRKKAREA